VYILDGGSALSYVTVYEITHESFLLSWRFPFIAGSLIFGVFAAIFLLGSRGLGCVTKIVRCLVLSFACLWVAIIGYNFRYHRRLVQAYGAGKYAVVEGIVEQYSWRGKTECFRVRGVNFCRGTASPGLLGWPIGLTREGLPLRVAYAPGEYPKILRLDVGRSPR
jgi:hypothetical protein